MKHSPNTAAVLLHNQMLEMEEESTTFAYFNFTQKADSGTTGSHRTLMDVK